VTSPPDWLVERAALDEVPPASRDRIERADPRELAERIAALSDDSAAELARNPAGPAVAEIEARIAAERRRRAERKRRRRIALLGLATSAAAVVVVARLGVERTAVVAPPPPRSVPDDVRDKGAPRLMAFRQAGERVELLDQDAVVRAGDLIQLRYNAGGQGYGMIASVDGAGVVTLHFPLSEDAPPAATAVARKTTALPHAWALDDAPSFERFFFVTANDPVDVQQTLGALRTFARRDDSATAWPELPAGLHQWSLRLRKPDRSSTNHESP
jgi:hypothetical protein